MHRSNPYAAPLANVADVHDHAAEPSGPPSLFTWRGRIGRLRYLARNTVLGFVLQGAMVALAAALGDADSGWLLLPYVAFMILGAFWTIQRSHDMNWSGWISLLCLIPLVNLIWVFKGGTRGANDYGRPPPPNTLLVKIGGLLLPILFVIGILAAVALPAYQAYVMRAAAAAAANGGN